MSPFKEWVAGIKSLTFLPVWKKHRMIYWYFPQIIDKYFAFDCINTLKFR